MNGRSGEACREELELGFTKIFMSGGLIVFVMGVSGCKEIGGA